MTEVLRWVRALTLACLLLLTGVGGHVAADGTAPAAAWLAGLLVLATVVLAPALGAPASSGRVALLLVAGQLLLHLTLMLAAAPPAGFAGTAGDAMAHGSMTGSPMVHGHAASAGVMPALTNGAHLGMVLAHLAAALAVALWLAAGERAVWTLLAVAARPVVEALARTLQAACAGELLVVGPVHDRRPGCGNGSHLPVRSDVWLECVVSRRGPPSVVVA